MDKNTLRKELKSLRNRLSKEEVAQKSAAVCQNILRLPQYQNANTVFAYLAFGGEVNIDAVIADALAQGKTLCVPLITGPHTMQAARLTGFSGLAVGAYGIRTVREGAEIIRPQALDLVLLPGLGFDWQGRRLGMGAGFYDRFLASCPQAFKAGITYSALVRAQIPTEATDIPADWLITETASAACGKKI